MHVTTTIRRGGAVVAIIAALALLATLMPAPGGQAADHLDAPGLTPPGGDVQADINDLYAFAGEGDTTVLAMTVVPAAPGDASFGSDLFYELKVDVDGDAVEDHSFELTFSDVRDGGAQYVIAQHAEGEAAANGVADGSLAGFGQVGKQLSLTGGAKLFTGLRSDPFFFDLGGFLGTVEGVDNGRQLNDGNESDFFAPLDTVAIVLELPDEAIGLAEGTFGGGLYGEGAVGVWATTSDASGSQIDRIGRPAINTAVNSSGPIVNAPSENKNVYNQSEPKDDAANFTGAAASALTAYSSLDAEGAYTECQLGVLATVFLPDILPFSKNSALPSPVVGRALEDDVIDVALRVVTGGDPLNLFGPDGAFCTDGPDRDADGAINTDGIGPHTDYLPSFPYLGEPHSDVAVEVVDAKNFRAALSGENEVPAVESDGSGMTALRETGSGVAYLNVVQRLEGVVQGHIHLGDADENGPVVAFVYGPTDPVNVSGTLSSGVISEVDLVAGTISDLDDVMNGGFAYVNLHTMANPGGEIRGQVEPLGQGGDRFADDDGNVHETNIDIIGAAGITLGCNPPANSEYCPEREISRGEMAAFLDRALNIVDGPDAFVDDEASVFEDHINAIAAVGITKGCNPPRNDAYCADNQLTRGEMAAFVARAWNLPASATDHFVDDEGSVFQADINRLAEAGVTRGCNPPANDRFCPDQEMTRAEMASFLSRAFGWGG